MDVSAAGMPISFFLSSLRFEPLDTFVMGLSQIKYDSYESKQFLAGNATSKTRRPGDFLLSRSGSIVCAWVVSVCVGGAVGGVGAGLGEPNKSAHWP